MNHLDAAPISRRTAIRTAAALAAVAAAPRLQADDTPAPAPAPLKGRITQGVSRWCYGKWSLDELCINAKRLGIQGIDLLGPGDFATVKKHGLVCSMVNSHGIAKGFNRRENHAECAEAVRKSIDAAAEAGFPNVICFSGNRAGLADDEGAKNCVEGLKQVMALAEQKKVTVVMELLNSKRDHRDYMCDRTAWGAGVAKALGSERFKLLYDIYHMQIQEGDVIATIRQFKDCIGHYHTGGVPGRHEIDAAQELNYPAIMTAIADTGFKGFVAHEFTPTRNPLASLTDAVRLCDV